MKILVIDIGNTSTSLGVYSNNGITKSLKVLNPNDKKIKIGSQSGRKGSEPKKS